jgi:putative membrane protein
VTVADLPALNASLNGLSAILLITGFVFIRKRQIERHRLCMIGALVVSTLFLISYVVYHAQHGATPFPGTGWTRTLYFLILVPHVLLAMTVVPLALVTLLRAWREDFTRHRAIAVWTFPIWMYVSVTGVLVYWMLRSAYAAVPTP